MNVGLDLFEATLPERTGIGVYAHDLARALFQENRSLRFLGFIKRGTLETAKFASDPQHFILEVATPGRNRTFWSQIALPLALRSEKLDLLHIPGHRIPLWDVGVPIVATIHDLAYRIYPESFRAFHRHRLRWFTEATIRKARRFIVPSIQTKQDLMRFYHVPESKIDVIPHGVSENFFPMRAPEVLCAFRKRWGLPERYVLHLGSLQPRKNLTRLIQAWRLVLKRCSEHPTLILIGKVGWGMEDLFRETKPEWEARTILYLGYMPEWEIPLAINAATALVMPSLYEGFGLPVLEAMACDIPVACSRTSCLPEVVGDCAELFDPLSIEEMAQALQKLLENPAHANQLAQKGLARTKGFTWRATASSTIHSYHRAI